MNQDTSGSITLGAKEKLYETAETKMNPRLQKQCVRNTTFTEIFSNRNIVRRLLYVARFTNQVICFSASDAATRGKAPNLHYFWALQHSLKYCSNFKTEITFNDGSAGPFWTETMCVVSMRKVEQKRNICKGIGLLQRKGITDHAINGTANLSRRVARSTCTSQLLAAADAVHKGTYLSLVLKNINIDHPTELVVDSRVPFQYCTTLSKLAEA